MSSESSIKWYKSVQVALEHHLHKVYPSLDSSWKVFEVESYPQIPFEYEYTHVMVSGCNTALFSKGVNKGEIKWLKEGRCQFMLSCEDYFTILNSHSPS